MRTKTLWLRDEYMAQILNGSKTVEVRAAYSNIVRLQTGDRLLLNDRHPYLIRRVTPYGSLNELLAHEDPTTIAPDLSSEELLAALQTLYPPVKEALGIVAIEIEPEMH